MATNPNITLVQDLATKVTSFYNTYLQKKQISDDITNGKTLFPAWGSYQIPLPELKRQYEYHMNRGDTANANVVKPYYETAKAAEQSAIADTNAAKANYDQAFADYQKASSSLLTDAEKAQMDSQLKSGPNYASSGSKYWIIGGIVLILVVAGIMYFIKKNKQ